MSRSVAVIAPFAALSLASCGYLPPDCDSEAINKAAVEVMNGSDDFKNAGVTVKEVRKLVEASYDADKKVRVCKGEMEASNGQVLDLVITLDPDKNDPSKYTPTIEWVAR